MKMAAMLAAVTAAMLANIAAPALARKGEEGRAFSYPMGGPIPDGYPPPDYAYRGGEVYVDGDEVIGCDEFAGDFEGFYGERGDRGQAERVLERCGEAGLPGIRIPAEVRAEVRAARDADRGAQRLPETGGVPPSLLAAGLLLSACAAGLLALRKTG